MSEVQAEERFNAYFCSPPSMQVIDGKGQPMVFISGRFVTKDPGQIALLDDMCLKGTGSIFKNPDQLTLSAADLDPENALRAKYFKEFQEQQAQNFQANPGDSVQTQLTPASTTDIAPVTLGHGAPVQVSGTQLMQAASQTIATIVADKLAALTAPKS
jgi:hypothetical protein